jgi:hypothetical protein
MTSSAKGPGRRADAHRGLGLAGEAAQGGRRRGPSGVDGAALVERVDAGRLRAPGLHGSTREAPAEMLRGSRRSGSYRR